MSFRQRPFRFGTITKGKQTRKDWVTFVHKVEDNGYDTLSLADHLDIAHMAISIGLASAAEISKTLRLGSFVYNNDLRHPAVLAKDIATLDQLSSGRLELGLGPGYAPKGYAKTGLQLDSAGIRIARMEESLQIMRGLFRGPYSFKGKYYRIEDLEIYPRPVQHPAPPIYIGGGGRKVLSLAAREANIIGLTAIVKADGSFDFPNISQEATEQKVGWIKEAAGERISEIELNAFVFLVKVTDQRECVAEQLAQRFHLPAKTLLGSPHLLIGSVEQIAEEIYERRERFGISYLTIQEDHLESFTPVIKQLQAV